MKRNPPKEHSFAELYPRRDAGVSREGESSSQKAPQAPVRTEAQEARNPSARTAVPQQLEQQPRQLQSAALRASAETLPRHPWIGVFTAFFLNIFSVIFAIEIRSMDLLPARYFRLLMLALLVLNLAVDYVLIFSRIRRRALRRTFRGAAYALVLILLVGQGAGIFYAQSVTHMLHAISAEKSTIVRLSVIVAKDDPAADISAVRGQTVDAVMSQDGPLVQQSVEGLSVKAIREAKNYPELVNRFYMSTARFLIFNEAFRPIVEELHPDFSERSRTLKTFELHQVAENRFRDYEDILADERRAEELRRREAEEARRRAEEPRLDGIHPFLLFLGANDAYGELDTAGRSDVNMVVAVNPQKHHLLFVTVPRDSYLPIAGGGLDQKDKLTHAGLYGVEASMQTLENLFETPIRTYMRANFSSLTNLVNAVGGITIDNPVAFETVGYEYPEGVQDLDGEYALVYSRERYSFEDGDYARANNQIRVIRALIDKLTMPENLLRFQEIMNVISYGFDTNLSPELLSTLVRNQLDKNPTWTIDKYTVQGHGETRLDSFLMPGYELSMQVLEDDSVAEARRMLREAIDLPVN